MEISKKQTELIKLANDIFIKKFESRITMNPEKIIRDNAKISGTIENTILMAQSLLRGSSENQNNFTDEFCENLINILKN